MGLFCLIHHRSFGPDESYCLKCREDECKTLKTRVAELEQVIRVIGPMNKELLGFNQDMSARIARLEYLIACNVDPSNCTDEDAELCRECHKTAFPENYRI